jgi:hypothetical protein
MTTEGAQCICDQGYMGDGTECALPRAMAVPNFVLTDGPLGKSKQIAEVHVSTFGGAGSDTGTRPAGKARIAVVYRNLERKNKGYLVIGTAEGENVEWSAPMRFSEKTEAWEPVVAGFEGDNKIVVAWRDREERGKCWSRVGLVGGVPESRDHVTWSAAKNFCGHTKDIHSERFQALALSNGKFVLLYGGGTMEANDRFGAAFLGEVTV